MIYRAKNDTMKGKVLKTLSFGDLNFNDEFELESRGSVSDSEKAHVSRIAQLKATVKERLRRMPASLAQRKSEQSNQSKSSSGKQSLVSHLSKRLRGAKKTRAMNAQR